MPEKIAAKRADIIRRAGIRFLSNIKGVHHGENEDFPRTQAVSVALGHGVLFAPDIVINRRHRVQFLRLWLRR